MTRLCEFGKLSLSLLNRLMLERIASIALIILDGC